MGDHGPRNQPLVLVLEDLQWFDPTSIDLVHTLSDRCAEAPILLLATARLEFRPPWRSQPHHKSFRWRRSTKRRFNA